MMHERIQKILSGGLGVLKIYFSFFLQRASADLASFSKHLDPRGPTSSQRSNSISKETYNNL